MNSLTHRSSRSGTWACLFAVFSLMTIEAHAQHTIGVTSEENCSVEVTPQKDSYNAGESITVTLTPSDGAVFDDFQVYYECSEEEYWQAQSMSAKRFGMDEAPKKAPRRTSTFAYRLEIYYLDGHDDDPVEVTKGKEYTFTMPDRNVEIEASFTLSDAKYNIIKSDATNGFFTLDKNEAKANETVTITTSPNTGYQVDEVKVLERDVKQNIIYETPLTTQRIALTTFTFTMPANTVRVEVTFKEKGDGIEIDNDDSNTDVINDNDKTTTNVQLKGRTLYKNNSWNTICLPFAVTDFNGTPLQGAEVRKLTSASFNRSNGTLTLNFTTTTSIEAGRPYIAKWTSGTNITNPTFNNVTITATTATPTETDALTFIGTFSPVVINGSDQTMLYMGGDNKLYYPNATMTIGACRAYFILKNGVTAGNISNTSNSKIVLNFIDDETTGITTTNYTKFTNSNDAWYSTDGRRLTGKPTTKGVYIHNGKKIVLE